MAGAAISLRNVDTNQRFDATSNSSGNYAFPSLPPGAYSLTAGHGDFAPFTRGGIRLQVGESASLDIELSLEARADEITVTAQGGPVDSTRTEVSNVVETSQIQALPNAGRLFTDFALLTPGAATGRTSLQSTITEFETTRVSFGGMRDLSNLVLVDGADTVNTVTGSQRATPPQDSVGEFRVVANSFSAEYGRALGGVINIVTKSGSNALNGTAYEYLGNDRLNARSLLQPAPSPKTMRQNQFGLALGGPLAKDRTFFFANYEGQRRAASPTFPALFTRNLNFFNSAKAALGLSPENPEILQTGDRDNGFVKADHQLGPSRRLTLRWNTQNGRSLNLLAGNTVDGGGVAAPSNSHNAFIQDDSLTGHLTSTRGSGLVNDLLLQWSRRNYDFPGVSGEPSLDIPNELMFGNHFGVFDAIRESRLQVSNAMSWATGSHIIRFGADLNLLADSVSWPGFTPMRIVLPGANCLAEFANFVNPAARLAPNPAVSRCPLPPVLNGTPVVFWGAAVGSGPLAPGYIPPAIPTNWRHAYLPSLRDAYQVGLNHQYTGVFLQDQWRAASKLTVNYGLRWDVETGLGNIIRRGRGNFSPRLGLAYAINAKTAVRAGFGMFFDRLSLPFVFVTYPQRPVVIPGVELPGVRRGAESAGWILNQLTPGPGGMPAEAARNLITTGQFPPQHLTGPSPPSCTAGAALVDPASRTPYAQHASFQLNHQIHNGLTMGLSYLFVAAHHQVRAENLNVSDPAGKTPEGKSFFAGPRYSNAGLLYYTDNSGNAAYHGATVQAAQRLRSWMQYNVNYTFSKTLDDGTFTTFVSTPQDLYQRNLERANSNQDVRHRLVASFSTEAPESTLFKKFQLSGIISLQSGRPFTLFAGYDANGDTNPVTDRVGLSARNTYYGDRLMAADIRLSREFSLNGETSLTLALDAFNALNRANVEEVNSVYGFSSFLGPVPRQYGDGIASPANPLFGSPRSMVTPRAIQLSVRMYF